MNADPRELALLIASKMTRDAEAETDRLDPWQAYRDLTEAIGQIEVPRKPTGKVGSDDAAYAWQCAGAIGVALGAVAEWAERLTRSCDHAAGRKLTPRGDFAIWCGKADQYLAEPLRDRARRDMDDRAESLRGRLVASSVNAGRR